MNHISIRNKIIIKQFIKFLKKNNALYSYIYYLRREEKRHIKDNDITYLLLFSKFTPSNDNLFKVINGKYLACLLIKHAFIWAFTKDGYNYWNDLSNEWETMLYKLFKEKRWLTEK